METTAKISALVISAVGAFLCAFALVALISDSPGTTRLAETVPGKLLLFGLIGVITAAVGVILFLTLYLPPWKRVILMSMGVIVGLPLGSGFLPSSIEFSKTDGGISFVTTLAHSALDIWMGAVIAAVVALVFFYGVMEVLERFVVLPLREP